MEQRVFGPEDEAVFDEIAAQRNKKGPHDDFFVYYVSLGQKELQSNGKARDCGIGCPEHRGIIQKLAEEGIIEADWIVSLDPQNKGRFILKYHDEKWMNETFSGGLLDLWLDDHLNYEDYFFIHLSFKNIKDVTDKYKAIYSCELLYDEEQCCFYVERKDTGKKYFITKLRSTMKPFKILLATFNSTHKHATRAWLNGDKSLYIGKSSLNTRVFTKKSVVRNELLPFVVLNPTDIKIETEAKLTFDQLKALEKA